MSERYLDFAEAVREALYREIRRGSQATAVACDYGGASHPRGIDQAGCAHRGDSRRR